MKNTLFTRLRDSLGPSAKLGGSALLGFALANSATAQTFDFIYGLNSTTAGNSSPYNLVEFKIDTVTNAITPSTIFSNLQSFIPGYGSVGRAFEQVNGLAINPTNNQVYFNYTYSNNGSNPTLGDTTFTLFRAQFTSSWTVDSLGSFTTPLSASGLAVAANGGSFPRGGFLNNIGGGLDGYYFGGNGAQNLLRIPLSSATGNPASPISVASVNSWADIDGSAALTGNVGGDMVINNGNIYTTTQAFVGSPITGSIPTHMRRGIDSSGAPTAPLSPPFLNLTGQPGIAAAGTIQLAGLGNIPRLYAIGTNSDDVFLYGNPDATTAAGLGMTVVGNVGAFLGAGTITDLSSGFTTSVIPEPSSTALLGLAGACTLLRRKRKA